MPPVKSKRSNQQWDVKDGKPVLVTPAVQAASETIPVKRLDREIERTAHRKEQAKAALDAAQTEYDELEKYEADLKALRAQVTE
jgi:chromosome segregation ATPase